jgi:hypothetical protein
VLPSYLHCRTFQISVKITSTRRNMRLVWPTGGVVSPVPVCERHAYTLQPGEVSAARGRTTRHPLLPVGYLKTYVNRLEHWLRHWTTSFDDSKSIAAFFAKTTRCVHGPRPVQFFGEPKQCRKGTVPWGSAHVNQTRRKAAQTLSARPPPKREKWPVHQKRCVAL